MRRSTQSVAIAKELQQEHEEVDEVEIEVQRPHDRGFCQPFAVHGMRMGDIIGFDLLRVIGGQAGKDKHANGGDRELKAGGAQEDVHDGGQHETQHTHDQERAPAGDVFLGGVAPERQAREGNSRHQKGLHDREIGEDEEDPAACTYYSTRDH